MRHIRNFTEHNFTEHRVGFSSLKFGDTDLSSAFQSIKVTDKGVDVVIWPNKSTEGVLKELKDSGGMPQYLNLKVDFRQDGRRLDICDIEGLYMVTEWSFSLGSSSTEPLEYVFKFERYYY